MLNDMMIFIIASAVVMTIVNLLKEAIPSLHERNLTILIITSVLGVVLAISYEADFFEVFGYTSDIPYVGTILTGIIVGGGSNGMYTMFKFLRTVISGKKEVEQILTEEQAENMAIERDDEINADTVSHESEEGVG